MKVHINVLYVAVLILLGLQILTFVSFSSQMSRLIPEQEEFNNEFVSMKQENQYNINEIIKTIAQQKKDIGGAESLGFALESNVIREKINLIADEELIG